MLALNWSALERRHAVQPDGAPHADDVLDGRVGDEPTTEGTRAAWTAYDELLQLFGTAPLSQVALNFLWSVAQGPAEGRTGLLALIVDLEGP